MQYAPPDRSLRCYSLCITRKIQLHTVLNESVKKKCEEGTIIHNVHTVLTSEQDSLVYCP